MHLGPRVIRATTLQTCSTAKKWQISQWREENTEIWFLVCTGILVLPSSLDALQYRVTRFRVHLSPRLIRSTTRRVQFHWKAEVDFTVAWGVHRTRFYILHMYIGYTLLLAIPYHIELLGSEWILSTINQVYKASSTISSKDKGRFYSGFGSTLKYESQSLREFHVYLLHPSLKQLISLNLS